MGRIRDRVFANTKDYNYGTEKTYNTSGQLVSTKSIVNYSSVSDVMSDYVTPNFKELQKAGAVIMKPMNHTIRNETNPPGSSTFMHKTNLSGWVYEGMNPTILQLSVTRAPLLGDNPQDIGSGYSDRIAMAKLNCLANIDSTPFNFMEDVAEIGSTINQLRNPLSEAKALARSFEDEFYRMRRKKNWTSAKCFSNAWLSVRYGFRPIVYSLLNIHSALEVASMRKPIRRTARARIEHREAGSGTFERPFSVGSSSKDYFSWEKEVREVHRATVVYEAPLLTEPLDLLGLRKKAIPRTAWNLMPYSWVVDRFVSVGTTVSALMNLADPRISILGACSVSEINTTYMVVFTGQVQPSYNVTTSQTPSLTISEDKTRTLWHPTTADCQPIVLPRIDGQFALDLSSLVVQRLRLGSFATR